MTTTAKKPRTKSTVQGRQWLRQTSNSAVVIDDPSVEEGSTTPSAGSSGVRVELVTIPDVSAQLASPVDSLDVDDRSGVQAMAQSLKEASEARLQLLARSTNPSSQNKASRDSGTPIPTTGAPRHSAGQAAIPPSNSSIQPKSPAREVAARDLSGSSQQGLEELAALANEIGTRFPAGRPAVLSFLSAEPDPMVDMTAREMARLLALTGRGPVLLIDSHLESRRLTSDSGAAQASGLIDATIEGRPWRPMIRSQWDRGVDFLPCGARDTETLGDSGALRSVMIEIKQSYQYVCVAAGAAALAGHWWSDVSDGCYLLVSLKNTHAAVARSAVAELQASGARLLGCVVTDVEGQGR